MNLYYIILDKYYVNDVNYKIFNLNKELYI